MTMTAVRPVFDPATFRRALGHVPTSVCVVTATDDDGPVGMTVGSFTSISLDPPLVGFFADTSSATLQRLRRAGHLTINLLSDRQDDLCGVFARKSDDRFAGVPLIEGDHRSPRLAGALAWIDCEIESAIDIGDHAVVVGRVHGLEVPSALHKPLVFFRGKLCQLDPRTVPSKGNWQRDHYAEW